jgi:hypothetical protein
MMEGVQLQMEKNGNSKEREEIMDTSALQEFDVTATYSFVDSHYYVMLSEENKVSKVVLVRGWDYSHSFRRPSPEHKVIITICEYPLSKGDKINLNDMIELDEQILPLSKHPARLNRETSKKSQETGNGKDNNPNDILSILHNKYIENAILSMYRGEEALVTLKESGKRFYVGLKDYDIKQYLCCVEGIEPSSVEEDVVIKYCECHFGDYICVAKDHTSCCKCCFLTCALMGLCAGAAIETE